MALHTGQSTSFEDSIYFSENNPFYRGALVGQCTWYCWSKAHAKATAYPSRGINVENIPTSGAGRWIADAKNKYEKVYDPKQRYVFPKLICILVATQVGKFMWQNNIGIQ